MANYRQIHVSIWKDEWFLELSPEEKLLFIYLFSNECASLSGIYKLAFKVICFETSLDEQAVRAYLDKFQRDGKVFYQDSVIWVVNMRHYNRGGTTVMKRIYTDIRTIPDCELKRMYLDYYAERPAIIENFETHDEKREEPTDTHPTQEDTLSIPYVYPMDTGNADRVNLNEMNLNEMKRVNGEIHQSEKEGTNGAKAPDSTAIKPASIRVKKITTDARSKHPAILLVKGITSHYPPLELYDQIIDILGDTPDGPKLALCRQEWVKRGYNGNGWGWLFDWYKLETLPGFKKPNTSYQPEIPAEEI